MSRGEEGVENVTKQIEDEQQLLGLKDEDNSNNENPEKPEQQQKKKEDPFERGQDLKKIK